MSQAAPGWYQVEDGTSRWWDGAAWTAAAHQTAADQRQSQERTLALLAHLGPIVGLSVIAPAIVLYKANSDPQSSPWLRYNAIESLNFHISFLIAYTLMFAATFVLGILTFGLALFVMIPIIMVMALVSLIFSIMATVASSRGEWYRYPVSLRFIS